MYVYIYLYISLYMYRYSVLSIGESLIVPHFSQRLDNLKKTPLIVMQQYFS